MCFKPKARPSGWGTRGSQQASFTERLPCFSLLFVLHPEAGSLFSLIVTVWRDPGMQAPVAAGVRCSPGIIRKQLQSPDTRWKNLGLIVLLQVCVKALLWGTPMSWSVAGMRQIWRPRLTDKDVMGRGKSKTTTTTIKTQCCQLALVESRKRAKWFYHALSWRLCQRSAPQAAALRWVNLRLCHQAWCVCAGSWGE